jgi:hypothetical protein
VACANDRVDSLLSSLASRTPPPSFTMEMMPPGSNGFIPLPPEFADPSTLPHDSQQPNLIACVVLTWFLGACFVAARLYTKIAIARSRLGYSEYFIVASCVRTPRRLSCVLVEWLLMVDIVGIAGRVNMYWNAYVLCIHELLIC